MNTSYVCDTILLLGHKIKHIKPKGEIGRVKKLFVIIGILLAAVINVSANPIYTYENTVPVTDSVALTTVNEFYSDKNISYSYITADLSDKDIKIKLLKSEDGADILETVPKLSSKQENTLAAINADFFSHFSGPSGFSLGIEIKDGQLLQSPIYPDTMATVSFDSEGADISYIDFEITLTAPNGKTDKVRHLNKHTTYYGDILMYTSDFNGGVSPAPGGPVIEVVVVDGVVAEMRKNMPPVEIPENGCVLVVSEWVNMFLTNNLYVGCEIKIETHASIDLEKVETAFGAGGVLVAEGETVEEFSHEVTGYNPRSAIGISEDGQTLYLVAVDGRQTSSKGMTMQELARLMKSLGCYNAVNLDGGGSTNLVASTLYDSELHSVNSPTENRKVINAVSIVLDENRQQDGNDMDDKDKDNADNYEETEETEEIEEAEEKEEAEEAEEKKVFGVSIKKEKTVLFTGESINLSAVVYDENMRPVDGENILWFCDSGSIEDGVFTADAEGKVTVVARCGEFSDVLELYVVDTVSGICVPNKLYLDENEILRLDVYVFDETGHFIKVSDPSLFEVTSSKEDVVLTDGFSLAGVGRGTAVVTVKKDNAKSSISVVVGRKPIEYYEGFEDESGRFISYPAQLNLGSFEISREKAFSENFSGRLFYDFRDEADKNNESHINDSESASLEEPNTSPKAEVYDETQTEQEDHQIEEQSAESEPDVAKGAYYALENRVEVDYSCGEISVYCYFESEFYHSLRAQFIDSDGKIVISEFEGDFTVGAWNCLTAPVPEKGKHPLMLDRIYVLYTPGDVKDCASVYLDELSFVTVEDYTYPDSGDNVYDISYNKNFSAVGKFAVGAVNDTFSSPVEQYYASMLERELGDTAKYEKSIIVGREKTFSAQQDENALYVTLNNSKNSLRTSDKTQWDKLDKAIKECDRQNVFIMCSVSPFGNDEFENRVFCDYLASLEKNVFVIWKSDKNTYMNVSGVNYFTLEGTENHSLSLTDEKSPCILEFTLGNRVTFEWKNLF